MCEMRDEIVRKRFVNFSLKFEQQKLKHSGFRPIFKFVTRLHFTHKELISKIEINYILGAKNDG